LPEAILARLPGMIHRCRNDLGRTIEFVSAGAGALLGVEAQKLLSDRASHDGLIWPEDRERVRQEMLRATPPGDTFTCEYRIKHADGQPRTVREQGRAVRDGQGEIVAWEGFVAGIAVRANAGCARSDREIQRLQAKNFKSVNMLAKGVAHDFNNLVAGIIGSVELIELDSAPEDPDREFLERILEVSGRAREMILQLRDFSQRKPCERALISLAPVVEECRQQLRSVIPGQIEIADAIEQNCPAVFADAAQVREAVMNLGLNAWHSLPKPDGRINLRLEPCEITADKAAVLCLCAGPHLRLSVRDSGPGLSQSMMERVFEPFACKTTGGKNSGLELFSVQEIAHAHEGAVAVESAPGEGTVFHLYFPVPA
jgi:PAS domain S-box-containing protein